MIYWPEALIAGLVERACVITLDNRDSGRSFFTELPPALDLNSSSANRLRV